MSYKEFRTQEQIREHYEVEKELASRLRNAPREERRRLYTSLYDELMARVPHHPRLAAPKRSPAEREREIQFQVALLRDFLTSDSVFLEIGPGDCALSHAVAKLVKHVYAVDVSDAAVKNKSHPDNCTFAISDGVNIPVPQESVDVAYSYQVMEHLHPDDAIEQLKNIRSALKSGGVYLCITPNRLSGPHDVSKYFDSVATGMHLREYTVGELIKLFGEAGFTVRKVYVFTKGKSLQLPVLVLRLIEGFLELLPYRLRRKMATAKPWKVLLQTMVVAKKLAM